WGDDRGRRARRAAEGGAAGREGDRDQAAPRETAARRRSSMVFTRCSAALARARRWTCAFWKAITPRPTDTYSASFARLVTSSGEGGDMLASIRRGAYFCKHLPATRLTGSWLPMRLPPVPKPRPGTTTRTS